MEEEIMTIKEVAAFLKMSEGAVRRYARKGELKGSYIGRVWRFKKSDVLNWFNGYSHIKDDK
ncbi:MAG: Helix-turn-helix domain protein [Pelotomaculum sp. PtaB.Bin013]|nr:MAG: Helix-turn-helix domain protein [Pelotomaculum sp. PtaB.Bin013]